jgi:hypothetical protein
MDYSTGGITTVYSWVFPEFVRRCNAPMDRESGVQNDSFQLTSADKFQVVGETHWRLSQKNGTGRKHRW